MVSSCGGFAISFIKNVAAQVNVDKRGHEGFGHEFFHGDPDPKFLTMLFLTFSGVLRSFR